MMRGVTFPPAAPPEDNRNVIQFAGGPQPALVVDCSDPCPNIQAARDYYPAFPDAGNDGDAAPRWVRNLDNELTGATEGFYDDEEDPCELPLCAPHVLTGCGYNRLYSEGGVRMHVRACLHA